MIVIRKTQINQYNSKVEIIMNKVLFVKKKGGGKVTCSMMKEYH